MPRAEPRHRPPRVNRQPQEGQRGHARRQGRRQRELDPAVPGRVIDDLLHDGHPLRSHPHRGQHRVGASRRWRPLGDANRRLLALRAVPVVRAGPEALGQVAERGLLELLPAGCRVPPLPVVLGPLDTRAKALERVIERPAERRLADHVPAVAGHAAAHVRPSGDDREQRPALQDGHAVAFLKPQRLQGRRVQRRPAAGVLGARGGHQRCLTAAYAARVGSSRGAHVVGDPGRGNDRRLIMQVRGGGNAVILDREPTTPIRAHAVEQRGRVRGALRARPHYCHIITICRFALRDQAFTCR